MSAHQYDDTFFRYIEPGSRRSAREVIKVVQSFVDAKSVLDVGCGRGVWLDEWQQAGVSDIFGVDGDYVSSSSLAIPIERFACRDLGCSFNLGRQFDLVQSLEVAEHIAPSSADTFVNSLTTHGKRILFSAATPGQGGEHHVNEQPYEYWRDKFAARGYRLFDICRPALKGNRTVESWYRYNALLFVHDDACRAIPPAFASTEIANNVCIPFYAPLGWRVRASIVKRIPQQTASRIAILKHCLTNMARRPHR